MQDLWQSWMQVNAPSHTPSSTTCCSSQGHGVQVDNRNNKGCFTVVFKSRKGHSPLTSADWWFHQGQLHTLIDYSSHGCCLCNRLFCVKKCPFWGQHVLPLIKIRILQLMAALTSAREQDKGEGCRPEGAGPGRSRRLQSKTEQAWRGQKSCLVHLWTHKARTLFSVPAGFAACFTFLPPFLKKQLLSASISSQESLSYCTAWPLPEPGQQQQSLLTFQTSMRFLWVEKPLLLLLCLWTHFISLIKRVSSYPCLRQGGCLHSPPQEPEGSRGLHPAPLWLNCI